MAERTAIVVDLGSKDIKAGYAYGWPNPEEPRLVTPSAATVGDNSEPIHAIHRGEIVDWDVLESVLYYSLYDQLGSIEGGEGPLLMIEPMMTPRRHRELLAQLAFEVFNVQTYFSTDAAVASLYAMGRLNGIAVDIGYEKIDIGPVLDGLFQPSAARRLPYGGRHLTTKLQEMLQHKWPAVDFKTAEKVKLACINVGPSPYQMLKVEEKPPINATSVVDNGNDPRKKEDQKSGVPVTTYTLPDGQVISVAEEGRQLGEVLLCSRLLGLDLPTLAEAIQIGGNVTTVHGEREARRALADNVLLCGGSGSIHGLHERLLTDLAAIAHPSVPPGLCPMPAYMPADTVRWAAWMGGALLAKIVFGATVGPNQPQQAITKADYEEMGPVAVHRKCS